MRGPAFATSVLLLAALPATAADTVYEIDPAHTFPSFEADHLGGLSVWRGKFNTTRGTVVLDRAASSGRIEVVVDTGSIDYGLDAMNAEARGAGFFDTATWPEATYAGTLAGFADGRPTRVDGELTLRGVTRPVTLEIRSFKCMPHPLHRRELCGADAFATIRRDEFGMSAGKDYGFDMAVDLRIQVEAVAVEPGKTTR
ncbi:polyisoprenoid-binding protein [Luteimonas viscosa]|uniref:Polyisoprenoid-binding protein n=1 Tax=Luteimonas viscosa TaxID=1132694 RepID=A0A5D4XQH1_9GAMM|nr:YceI family protein [Luteimonas viscosa]TYT26364.1 polyisoprenoid-binding protein [Luteimonas viscosa]